MTLKNDKKHDLTLSSGAVVDFKVSSDEVGNSVISRISISFDGPVIPLGGINASTLREIRISELMVNWFEENSKNVFEPKEEEFLWKQLLNSWKAHGRDGVPSTSYATLAYFYVKYSEMFPNNPTHRLALDLSIPAKTLQTRLSKARKLGLLTSGTKGTGKAVGAFTPMGRKLVGKLVESK